VVGVGHRHIYRFFYVQAIRPLRHQLEISATESIGPTLGLNPRHLKKNSPSQKLFSSMSSRLTIHIASALLVACCFLSISVGAATLTGKVIGISDGDTIDVLDSSKTTHRIRLAGIDAPEKAQPFGQRSKEHLSDSVFGKQVVVQGGKIDKYGRTVGKILVNGFDANLEQVRAGFAWHYKAYASEQSADDRSLYSAAEDKARAQHLGLWGEKKQMPPWEWRHGGKDEPTPTSIASGCPCSGESQCTGLKGGQYCMTPNGKKRYQ
jgi:micrococcal nuclease